MYHTSMIYGFSRGCLYILLSNWDAKTGEFLFRFAFCKKMAGFCMRFERQYEVTRIPIMVRVVHSVGLSIPMAIEI